LIIDLNNLKFCSILYSATSMILDVAINDWEGV